MASRLLLWYLATAQALSNSALSTRDSLKDCLLDAVDQSERVKFSDDSGFQSDHVRPYNLNFPYAPFAIVYPVDSTEVSNAIVCASKHSRKVQARSGGHDYTNKCIGGDDGAVVVDLKNVKDVQVDSEGIAKIGAGNRLRDVCEKLHSQGAKHMPHGSSPTVGIGGHATVGGLGLHSRLRGTSLDVMTAADLVLANGTIVHVSESKHPDVFWAVRGAGASFGIVTHFYFQTEPEPKEVVNFSLTVSSTDTAVLASAFKAYHEITTDRSLDPRLSSVAILRKNTVFISGVFFGTRSQYANVNFSARIPGVTEQSLVPGLSWMGHMNRTFDSISAIFPEQSFFYAKDSAIAYSTLPSNATIDAVFKYLQSYSGSENWFALIDLYGGAVYDIAADATSFPHRDLAYFFALYAQTESKTAQSTYDFVDKAVLFYQNSEPEKYLSYVGYTNLRIKGGPQRKYWGNNLPRLERIKAAVDPKDLFSTPQGIKPHGAGN